MKETHQVKLPVEVTYSNEIIFDITSEAPQVKASNTKPEVSILVGEESVPLDNAKN